MVYGEVGRFSLASRVEKRMINFWARLIEGKKSKLSHSVYALLRKLHENCDFDSRWIMKVKGILDNCGMSNIWEDNSQFSSVWLKSSLDLRLNDIDRQNWSDEVYRNRLCFNYRIFKQELVLEDYLLKLEAGDRISLCKFRCGNHRLPVANCRYLPDQPMGVCPLCKITVQCDEFHYVLVCPILNDIRTLYVKKCYYVRPDVLKFHQLFNATSVKQLKNLSKFCKIIMSKFT